MYRCWTPRVPETTALLNIGSLVTNDPALGEGDLGIIIDAAIVIEDGRVSWVGRSADVDATTTVVDLDGRAVLPGFVDSHAHLLFAGDRADEFAARMSGEQYAAGGIRRTVTATRAATDEQLASNLGRLAAELRRSGVTTFETKSGYGLTTIDEARALGIARSVTAETTYLGAHVVPVEFEGRPDDYVALVAGDRLDSCAPNSQWIDVVCDRGAVVVDADAIARAIVEPGEPALAEIREAFGPDVIDPSGRLDRSALAGIVFADADSLTRLNAITHPRIAARSAELLAAAPSGALLVYDMPLLVEQGPEALLGWDAIVVVDASDDVRLERLRARGMGADDARRRMDAQASREDRLAAATVILDNAGDVASLEEQVGHLWEDLRRQRT